jgi:hypothetical protein
VLVHERTEAMGGVISCMQMGLLHLGTEVYVCILWRMVLIGDLENV